MKKIIVTTFCILMLCSLLVIAVGTTMAAEPGYERISYHTQVVPTIDGMWTSPDEWTDGDVTWIGTDVAFRSTLDSGITRWIVEFLSDTTDDPGDYWMFCIDTGKGFAYSFTITGHTDLTWALLTQETGWIETDVTEGEVEWANSLSASPMDSTPHWILEFQKDKDGGQFNMDDVWNFLLAVNDASNPGRQMWPPTDPDSIEEYGIENYSPEPIPEVLTFGVMALLSSISVIVSYRYFVKRKVTKVET